MELRDLQLLLGEIDGLEVGSLRIESPRDGKEEDLREYSPYDPEDTPLFQRMRSEMKEILTRAIAELSEKEQQVLALYYFEELTMKEVGAILGVGESRVLGDPFHRGGASAGADEGVDRLYAIVWRWARVPEARGRLWKKFSTRKKSMRWCGKHEGGMHLWPRPATLCPGMFARWGRYTARAIALYQPAARGFSPAT